MNKITIFIIAVFFLASCSTTEEQPDAYGYFEADQTVISAESAGRLLSFIPEEGQVFNPRTICRTNR